MTAGDAAETDDGAKLSPSVDAFLEAKLHRPPGRGDWLRRERLLDRMRGARDHQVTLIAAPVGYGKTTLVAQWLAEAQLPRAAWVSLDAGDNDPNRLWTHVAAALERAGSTFAPPSPPHQDQDQLNTVAPNSMLVAIVDALTAVTEDIVLVLDDFHVIRQPTCHAQVEFLVEHLPPQAHLVIATRSDPGLRLGRLRAGGRLLEIRADDLGFTTAEASSLLALDEVALDDDSLSLLVDRTEGWPAGLYLVSLSLAGRPDPAAFVRTFSGDNRYIGDYLTEEVLSRHPAPVREFFITVSILDRFTASLCDHVAQITGSASLLHDLERTNLFLVPLDDERRWYRFHQLFAAVARSELEMTHPDRLASLHARAAAWFIDHGNVDEAVKHSIAAGDAATAGRLVQENWLTFVDAGRTATVLGWLDAIGPPTEGTDPAASVTSAWMAAMIGDEAALTHRVLALAPFRAHGPLPDGSRSVESAIAMIHGLFGYGGPAEMMSGAERAVALETDRHSPFFAVANLTLGHAAYVAGDLGRAVAALSDAWRNDRAPRIIRSLGLAVESLVEDERGNLDRSRECAEQAMAIIEEQGLLGVPQASLAYTALGRAQAASAQFDDALATLERGLAVRRGTSAQGPWGMLHHLVVHTRVAAEAGQYEVARGLLAELDLRLDRYPEGMEAMHARVAPVRRLVQAHRASTVLGEPLTGREVDILRLLQGPMSLQGMADDLYLSFNTVKTHTKAIYRKLGVHTRAEAVLAAKRVGLV
ncbi:MAG: LuxR C-terminal-related transcriptional regulator [Nocardioides sp.]